MSVTTVKRELLVRHLEAWAAAAVHRGRRAIYVHGYADVDGGASAEAAVRVLADLPDLARGRELSMVAVGDDMTTITPRLGEVQQQAGAGAGLSVLPIAATVEVAVRAAGAKNVPTLGYLDAGAASEPPAVPTVACLAAGKPAEVLLVLPPGASADPYRTAGFPLLTAAELATGEEPGQVVVFATGSGKSLEQFKEALWAVDEFAGVRLRDPADPERHLIDISLQPHPGPLRREILAYLGRVGAATVSDLRTFALTGTVYRAADANRVLHLMIDAGVVAREPAHGRLGGDVLISPI
ncbi:hypothetical protein ACWT_6653 [Actinoplanes sp. SE50]|uniref:hypothetical protein n=1 Tax=unclassified Actinoplanes TaxID=2626549 RepID=UPI00023ECA27|nr:MULTISPECIES: hypothetical protein [unclassified Actinoplanes]AEV87665.1 hypothetical protein ACPL_6783 [Actinoplanes sp. SE50/110]ATO86068.1 hypothetical protein ACWT_6653 [Actinoplanes sp. SE50]SLM03482.1 uncharacterized protein ACSP50_6772 [Actinoplanes sp. SE50/110]